MLIPEIEHAVIRRQVQRDNVSRHSKRRRAELKFDNLGFVFLFETNLVNL
ncbi:hypothetical protein Enr17x_01290 [Gimesia fumaroli]|jgi:hypothetical protein|uniref:Uncharacterized protein n=1 Tax=Gimesia fumaroli TaxID=2527976 RepID=A0A518I4U3_9PLAN|nr:hypothetical protein Enr17x_01290 [Gimesia fumaroli]